jgi:hypothetical protein
MTDVQDKIDSVLGGDAPRRELEQLARRFDLSADDRRHVDEYLRLLTGLDRACEATDMPPGAIDRAAATIRRLQPDSHKFPEASAVSSPGPLGPGTATQATARTLLDRYLNGDASRRELEQAAAQPGLDADLRTEIAEVLTMDDRLRTTLGGLPVPDGAVDRLKQTLHTVPPAADDDQDVQAAWGGPRVDDEADDAAHDTDEPQVFRPHRTYFEGPDVLAAGKDVRHPDDESNTDDKDDDEKSKT